jgi:hypothetical protein
VPDDVQRRAGEVEHAGDGGGVKCRYGVNGDGTATDYDTGLQWEQKTSDGSIHDVSNFYRWDTAFGGTTPNGTVFTDFLGTLNTGTSGDGTATSGCFAGHCDWRLPAIDELAAIQDLSAPGCSTSTAACIDQTVFGPTATGNYWSATTDSGNPANVWYVDFNNPLTGSCGGTCSDNNGGVDADGKDDPRYVRAVRSAL